MKIYKKRAKILPKKKNRHKNSEQKENYETQLPSEAQERGIFPTIDENFDFFDGILGQGISLVKAKFDILDGKAQIGIAYIQGTIDTELLSSQVIKPLLLGKGDWKAGFDDILNVIQTKFISLANIKKVTQMEQVVDSLLNGNTVLFLDGKEAALIIGNRKVDKRSIETPDNEVTVFASKESFIEDMDSDCAMIIKQLPTPNLHFETFTVGTLSHTKVKLIWIEGIANLKMVEEAKRRIKNINIDNVNNVGVLTELIEDNPLSLFPKFRNTQRPDVVARYLTNGHFAILSSNSPNAVIAPISFWDHFKTMDDYSERSLVSSFLRIVRYISFLLAIFVSPLYLSAITYNHSLLPPSLAMNIAKGREGVPFPSVVELLFMTLTISIIREASLRIPGSVGYFIGTLAAVTIGQSAVTAGYVSASVIIVVAVAAISSFAISSTSLVYPTTLINYLLIFLSGMFGMFGLINGIVILLWYMVSLKSFEVPYLYPVLPFDFEGMKDTFIRAPFNLLKKRLRILAPNNCTRMSNNSIKPKNEKSEGD